ncbi:MAG: DUF58 domain-containing protein [Spirochaetia bacterium]|nr:DUF58 domain-containing protein [Spirochaetia bacterium]
MIFPTHRFLWAAAVPLVLSMGLLPLDIALGPEYSWISSGALRVVAGADVLLLVLFLLEAVSLPRHRHMKAMRHTDPVYSIHYPHEVVLDIVLVRRAPVAAVVRDDWSADMETAEVPEKVELRPGTNRIVYRLRVNRRGLHVLELAYVTCVSRLGFTKRVLRLPVRTELRVYPDLKAVSKYLLLARKSHLGLLGIRRTQRGGGDNEFERLREYQRDDEYRHIDWKASAKTSRLIVRTYQMNQNQTIIFMVDCGRMMTATVGGRTLLDYTLNSVLLLSRVALGQGDSVGFLAFDSSVHRYVKPAGGAGHHRRLVRAAHDLFPSHKESNFDLAFQHLNTYSRKRSLVCLVTNVIDEMNAEMIRAYLGSLAGRHLPFAVLIRPQDLDTLLSKKPETPEGWYTQAAAADFLHWKERVVQGLMNDGVLVMEAPPQALDTEMINRYLSIKARKLL